MTQPWIEKYTPQKVKDVIGQDTALAQVKEFVNKFKKGKALFLWGQQGNGKTSSVHALAHDLGLELVEINASDVRNKDSIEERIGNAVKQQSLFSKGKIILIDEIDGVSGTADRGGLPAIIELIKKSSFPVILTANDPFDKKFSGLRKASSLVEFKSLSYLEIADALKEICRKESIKCDEEALKTLSRMAGGDMRSAINDLQNLNSDGKIGMHDVEQLSARDLKENIIQAILKVFKTKKLDIALPAFNNINEDLDELFLWMDENLPEEYKKPKDLAMGFDNLALADVFRGRIRKWQHYRFYAYIYDLLSAGIALSKDEKYPGFTQYKPTSRLLKYWMAKQKNMKKQAIAERIAEKTHTSKKRAYRDTLPYIQVMFQNKPSEALSEYLGLGAEEVEWLRK
jgi:replication factor C large subunit